MTFMIVVLGICIALLTLVGFMTEREVLDLKRRVRDLEEFEQAQRDRNWSDL